jgi:hypothetical protein
MLAAANRHSSSQSLDFVSVVTLASVETAGCSHTAALAWCAQPSVSSLLRTWRCRAGGLDSIQGGAPGCPVLPSRHLAPRKELPQ